MRDAGARANGAPGGAAGGRDALREAAAEGARVEPEAAAAGADPPEEAEGGETRERVRAPLPSNRLKIGTAKNFTPQCRNSPYEFSGPEVPN